jgi:hypothetical protein
LIPRAVYHMISYHIILHIRPAVGVVVSFDSTRLDAVQHDGLELRLGQPLSPHLYIHIYIHTYIYKYIELRLDQPLGPHLRLLRINPVFRKAVSPLSVSPLSVSSLVLRQSHLRQRHPCVQEVSPLCSHRRHGAHTDTDTHRHTPRQTQTQTHRHTDRHADTHRNTQTHTHACTERHTQTHSVASANRQCHLCLRVRVAEHTAAELRPPPHLSPSSPLPPFDSPPSFSLFLHTRLALCPSAG